jgi:ABC-type nitrate/sulfonate/bicarbonate transport system ATPase subunit
MRQRVALLRAMLPNRDVLLLDEPFGALDAITRASLHLWLAGLLQSSDKTVLLVTHDVEEAVLLSDRVHVMTPRPGRIGATVEVDLPRRRSERTSVAPRFVELKARLLKELARTSEAPA